MKTNGLVLAVVLAFCSLGMGQAKDETKTVTSVVDGTVKTIEGELVERQDLVERVQSAQRGRTGGRREHTDVCVGKGRA